MRIENNGDIDRVRDATDLLALIGEHVALRPRGREHVGLCPFHEDHRPSFAVVSHKDPAFYKCFACGAGGECFRFVMDYHKMSFGEALRYLAERAGITLAPRSAGSDRASKRDGTASREDLLAACAGATKLFRKWLADDTRGHDARAYLARRAVAPEMIDAFELGATPPGYDSLLSRIAGRPDSVRTAVAAGLLRTRAGGGHYDAFRNRLIFPIADDVGRTIAFGARALDPEDNPKYLNSPESKVFHKSKTLYGLHVARRTIIASELAIVVEGYTDVIACHQAGITNVVGTLGTALTPEHAQRLARLAGAITLVFDGDAAGVKAAERAVAICFAEPVAVRICVLPDGMDPDELLRADDGPSRFRALVDGAPDALEYDFDCFRAAHGAVSEPAARERIAMNYLDRLGQLGLADLQGVRRHVYVSRIADLVGMAVEAVDRVLATRRNTRPAAAGSRLAASTIEPAANADDAHDRPPAPDVGRARRIAEHALLGIVLTAPEVLERQDPGVLDRLREPRARAIADAVLRERGANRTPAMGRVLESLQDDAARALAIRLHDETESAVGDEDPDTIYAAALITLDRQMEREASGLASPAQDVKDLLSAVAAARAAGDRPDAISTRYRE